MTTTTQTLTQRMGRPEGGGPTTVTATQVGDTPVMVGTSGRVYEHCGRCSPTWSGSVTHFGHVYAGVCFECAGRGFARAHDSLEAAEKAVARRAKARASAARRRERKAAEQAAEDAAAYTGWRTEHADLADALEALAADIAASPEAATGTGALYDFAMKAARQEPLTAKQAEFADVLFTERAQAQAAEAERKAVERYAGLVGDTVSVTGVVAKAIYLPAQNYGWSSSNLIIVAGTGGDTGITVKTFTAAAWADSVEEGEEITLTGQVKDLEVYEGVAQTTLTRPRRAK